MAKKQQPLSPADYIKLEGDFAITPVVRNPKVPSQTLSNPKVEDDGATAFFTILLVVMVALGGMAFFANRINSAWVEGQQAKANSQGEAAIAKVEKLKEGLCQ